jgi:hypothetical protein
VLEIEPFDPNATIFTLASTPPEDATNKKSLEFLLLLKATLVNYNVTNHVKFYLRFLA